MRLQSKHEELAVQAVRTTLGPAILREMTTLEGMGLSKRVLAAGLRAIAADLEGMADPAND